MSRDFHNLFRSVRTKKPARRITRSFGRIRETFVANLLLGAQKNFSVAGLENEYLSAVADAPAFDTRGRVMSSATLKPSLLISSGELVSMVKLEPAGTVSEIWPSPVRAASAVEVAIQSDFPVAGARIDLTVKLDNADHAVAGVHLKLPAAVRDFDWTIA